MSFLTGNFTNTIVLYVLLSIGVAGLFALLFYYLKKRKEEDFRCKLAPKTNEGIAVYFILIAVSSFIIIFIYFSLSLINLPGQPHFDAKLNFGLSRKNTEIDRGKVDIGCVPEATFLMVNRRALKCDYTVKGFRNLTKLRIADYEGLVKVSWMEVMGSAKRTSSQEKIILEDIQEKGSFWIYAPKNSGYYSVDISDNRLDVEDELQEEWDKTAKFKEDEKDLKDGNRIYHIYTEEEVETVGYRILMVSLGIVFLLSAWMGGLQVVIKLNKRKAKI